MEGKEYYDPSDQEAIPEAELPEEDILAEAESLLDGEGFADIEQESILEPEEMDEFVQDLNDILGDSLETMHGASEGGFLPSQGNAAPEEFRDQEYRDTFGDDLDRVFEDAPEEDAAQEGQPEERPSKPGRPKKPKKGSGLFGIPHFLATLLYFSIILIISVTLARMLWLYADDMLALSKPDAEVTVTIDSSDTLDNIADKLVDAGLVRYKKVFLLYAKFSNAREKISSGTFTLNSMYDYHALVSGMSRYSSFRTTVSVMIPEGYNCRQIFSYLEEKGVCSAADLETAAVEGEYEDYWFLDGVEQKDKYCLEGYLFPDTYDFYENDDPQRVIEKMLDNFERRFRDSMQELIPTLNDRLAEMMRSNGYDEDYIAEHRATIREVVIVASLIEKETANNTESPAIASVIYNRLTNAKDYPYLDIDATILYALGEHKETLTAEDLQIDSPYNTRNHTGLPIGPIANPGLASLQAALNPDDSDYHYYALDKSTGTHHFSKTYEEHEAFLQSQSDE